MLSEKSEQFLLELRMYLISKGKNDQQIQDIIEELEDHLLQAEADGKGVEQIVGNSPKAYMKSIGETMQTDFRQLAILAPMVVLLLVAYGSLSPAITGTFVLSTTIIWIATVLAVIGIAIYSLLLFKIMPKISHSKWIYILSFVASIVCIGVMVLVLLLVNQQGMKLFFVATPMQNNFIVIGCMVVFIASALYTKTWITVIIPLFLAIGPIAERWIPKEVNENPIYITIAVVVVLLAAAIFILYFIRKTKKDHVKRKKL